MAGHSDIKAAAFFPPDYLDWIFNLRCDDGISGLLSEGNSMFFTEVKPPGNTPLTKQKFSI